jgi:hypothetical protein
MNNISLNNAMKLGNSTEIVSLKLVDINTQKEYLAKVKFDSRKGKMSECHFFEDIETQTHIIKLRLDWSDTLNGEPTLDANILDKNTGSEIPTKRNSWHHTMKKLDSISNKMLYQFEFENYKASLITIKNVHKKISDEICFTDEIKLELKKGES